MCGYVAIPAHTWLLLAHVTLLLLLLLLLQLLLLQQSKGNHSSVIHGKADEEAEYLVALLGGRQALSELQKGHLLQQVVPAALSRVKLPVPPRYLLQCPAPLSSIICYCPIAGKYMLASSSMGSWLFSHSKSDLF